MTLEKPAELIHLINQSSWRWKQKSEGNIEYDSGFD